MSIEEFDFDFDADSEEEKAEYKELKPGEYDAFIKSYEERPDIDCVKFLVDVDGREVHYYANIGGKPEEKKKGFTRIKKIFRACNLIEKGFTKGKLPWSELCNKPCRVVTKNKDKNDNGVAFPLIFYFVLPEDKKAEKPKKSLDMLKEGIKKMEAKEAPLDDDIPF